MPRVKPIEANEKHEVEVDAAASSMGVGLPPSEDRQMPEGTVYAGETLREPEHSRRFAAYRKGRNIQFRWVAADDRENWVKAQDNDWRLATVDEARAAGIQRGQKMPDGTVAWGRDLRLMTTEKDKYEARKMKEAVERNRALKRRRDDLKEEIRRRNRDTADDRSVFGAVKVQDQSL